MSLHKKIPNILTILRMVLVVPLMAAFFLPQAYALWVVLAIFAVASVSDWVDGYWARRYQAMSEFGKCFDPIADKLIVIALMGMIMAMLSLPVQAKMAMLVILLREIFVSGLREFIAAQPKQKQSVQKQSGPKNQKKKADLPVSVLAKWKTATQMLALFLLLAAEALSSAAGAGLAHILLWLAAALSVLTAYDYLRRTSFS